MKNYQIDNQLKLAQRQTIDFYDENAREYFQKTIDIDMQSVYERFLIYVTPHAKLLDAGSGSGRDTKWFYSQGFNVTAIDASKEMVKVSSNYTNNKTSHATFDEMPFNEEFDAIWCSAVLLHIPSIHLLSTLKKFKRALKPNGIWFLSFKYGHEEVIREGRFFCDQTDESLSSYLSQAGDLEILEMWHQTYEGQTTKWLNCIVRKLGNSPIPLLKKFAVEKLIRDKLPQMMRNWGIVLHERSMDNSEFIVRLREKLLEEAAEVANAALGDELTEELADVLEVVNSLAQAQGVTLQDIEEKRIKKRMQKGGFDQRIYNPCVEVNENNKAISYFLQKPNQYPEIKSYPDCFFCQVASQQKDVEIVERNKHCFVIMDNFPVSKGHMLIIPNAHTDNWFTASEVVRLDMLSALDRMKEKLDREYFPDGYNVGANCGEFAGQSVMHLHLHLIPRYKGDMKDPKGGVRGVIPEKQKY